MAGRFTALLQVPGELVAERVSKHGPSGPAGANHAVELRAFSKTFLTKDGGDEDLRYLV